MMCKYVMQSKISADSLIKMCMPRCICLYGQKIWFWLPHTVTCQSQLVLTFCSQPTAVIGYVVFKRAMKVDDINTETCIIISRSHSVTYLGGRPWSTIRDRFFNNILCHLHGKLIPHMCSTNMVPLMASWLHPWYHVFPKIQKQSWIDFWATVK